MRREPLEPDDHRHGTYTGYVNHACRCTECFAGLEQWKADRLAKIGTPDGPEHGTTVGYSYGCRCEDCRDAKRVQRINRYERVRDGRIRINPEERGFQSKPPPGPWAIRGNCVGVPIKVMFPERGDNAGRTAICDGCEVRQECLDYALSDPADTSGVWGGMTPTQRKAVRSDRHRKAAS